MVCKSCGLEMRIVRAGVQLREEADGTKAYHVSVVRCVNAQCPDKDGEQERCVLLSK